jgi:hypothetical protein
MRDADVPAERGVRGDHDWSPVRPAARVAEVAQAYQPRRGFGQVSYQGLQKHSGCQENAPILDPHEPVKPVVLALVEPLNR